MIEYKPFAAFGTVVILVSAEAGDTSAVTLGHDGFVMSGYYYITAGKAESTLTKTGEILEDRTPGWLNTEHELSNATTDGELSTHFPEYTEWLCIPSHKNKYGLPNLTSLSIKTNDEKILTNGTNLYLVRGTLSINNKVFIGPKQIRIRSGDVTATASEDCYSLIFK